MDFTEVIDNAKRFAGKKQDGDNYDDLFVDRLHNRYTVAVLICFFIAISTYQYVGTPLKCWVPAQFTDNYEDYTDLLCFIQNTYHVAENQIIPKDFNLRRERTLKYYQWIHFVLLLQALFFSLPRIIWQSFNDKIGLSIGNLVNVSNRYESFDNDEDQNRAIKYISDCLQRYEEYVNLPNRKSLSRFQHINRQCYLFCQGRTGSFLACFYIFIKILYICNLIFQILFLQYFLSYHNINYMEYGFNVFKKLFFDFSLPESKLFPRITLCDFQIRELGERHKYTVECILVINIFIEKMYFILWIWFGILLIITIIDIIYLIYRIFFRHSRNIFLIENLDLILSNRITKEKQFQYFRRYFPIDNLFALWIISANSNSLIIGEILNELFQRKLRNGSDV
ncbi:unnamed protein product [Rotaria sordida]|uniref:Innexin n=2 Tax=Rotaria sordida TaxID=392033 RepID=A0A819AQC6_9BILA|nr:unnamed protein product [Rotaria sordida]CAF1160386.1 unnamed protein product [Rotaria sordida]CAF1276079.1 unnamed protein product [Rotaria sordida]CAF1497096.1 unnamed protein product [Rotaria sordida]CAF3770714.1 unnamed protein product [Rotaria sordida]